MSSRSKSVAAFMAAALFLSATVSVAQESDENLPSVDLRPAGTNITDPNLGGWFVLQLEPGQTGTARARITNPANRSQHVKLYLADLVFVENGTPEVRDGDQMDVGAWGRFLQPDLTVGPRQTVDATFEVTVPQGAEPGDHIGVVVAQSDPESGAVRVVKRVATRIYVTVPGEARRSMEIDSVTSELDTTFWPRRLVTTVGLRNTGRIRLNPLVSVSNTGARGPEVLLARAVEDYVAEVRVPWYGGPVKLSVQASAAEVPTARLTKTRFVFPWHLFLALVLGGDVAFLIFRWRKKRRGKVQDLEAELARLEALVQSRSEEQH